MTKAGISLDIPGFGSRHITTILTDYTGTLSCGGQLSAGVGELLCKLAECVDIQVITADTYGFVENELKSLPVTIRRLTGDDIEGQKQAHGNRVNLQHCVVLGNGNNDRLLLKATKEAGGIAIAVDNGEGCATDALLNSNVFIAGAMNALKLLLVRKGLVATLRF